MQETENERAEDVLVEKSQLLDIKQNYSLQNHHIQSKSHQKHCACSNTVLRTQVHVFLHNKAL